MAKSKFFSEFRTFIERGSAIDMAVGIIVGSVMTNMVNSLVKDVIMPPIGVILGNVDFSQFFIVLSGQSGVHYNTIADAQAAGAVTMNIGVFLNTVVSFLITMFAVFMFVRIMNKVRLSKIVSTRTCPYCKSKINAEASKCPNCCSEVMPEKKTDYENNSELEKNLKKLKRFAKYNKAKIKEITNKIK